MFTGADPQDYAEEGCAHAPMAPLRVSRRALTGTVTASLASSSDVAQPTSHIGIMRAMADGDALRVSVSVGV
jgi:hypothetical protein